jgi:hypothetical protein
LVADHSLITLPQPLKHSNKILCFSYCIVSEICNGYNSRPIMRRSKTIVLTSVMLSAVGAALGQSAGATDSLHHTSAVTSAAASASKGNGGIVAQAPPAGSVAVKHIPRTNGFGYRIGQFFTAGS